VLLSAPPAKEYVFGLDTAVYVTAAPDVMNALPQFVPALSCAAHQT